MPQSSSKEYLGLNISFTLLVLLVAIAAVAVLVVATTIFFCRKVMFFEKQLKISNQKCDRRGCRVAQAREAPPSPQEPQVNSSLPEMTIYDYEGTYQGLALENIGHRPDTETPKYDPVYSAVVKPYR